MAWGEGKGIKLDAPTVTNGETTVADAVAKVLLIDLRVPLPAYRGDMVDLDIIMDVLMRQYEIRDAKIRTAFGSNYTLEHRQIAIPFGVQAAVYPLPNLRLRTYAGYDPVFGLIGLLASSVAAPIPATYALSLDADWRLLGGLSVTAGAEIGGGHINFNRAISQKQFRGGLSYAF